MINRRIDFVLNALAGQKNMGLAETKGHFRCTGESAARAPPAVTGLKPFQTLFGNHSSASGGDAKPSVILPG